MSNSEDFARDVAHQFEITEKRIDGLEQMLAQVMLGITDLWAGVEQALTQLMQDSSEEEQQKFKEATVLRRNEMLKAINALVDVKDAGPS